MPKVSICIPTYNQLKYLEKCISSILMQEYTDYEIIVSDDSTNNDVEVFISSIKTEQKIYYYKNAKPLGTPENWNFAISKSNGDYIKLLHHDDFFTRNDSLHQFVSLLDNNPEVNIGFSSTEVLFVKTNRKMIQFCTDRNISLLKKDFYYLFFKNIINAPSTTIYRKNVGVIYDISFKWLVDVDFYISVLEKNNFIAYLKTPLVCITNGAEGQVTQQVQYDKQIQVKEHVLLFSKIYNKVKSKNNYFIFFDELFLRYNIKSLKELNSIIVIPDNLNIFFENVFFNLNKNVKLKKIIYRIFNSKYNKKIFKFEKYKL